MEDRIAREGVLARCAQDPKGALNDMECANASRAASAVALEQERMRREELERESQRKLEALRREMARREAAESAAAEAAAAAAAAAYEAQWVDGADTAPLAAPDTLEGGLTSVAAPLSFIELPAAARPIAPAAER